MGSMTLFRLECPKQGGHLGVPRETPNGQVTRVAPLSKHGNFGQPFHRVGAAPLPRTPVTAQGEPGL